jgi:hypothetical protein
MKFCNYLGMWLVDVLEDNEGEYCQFAGTLCDECDYCEIVGAKREEDYEY